MNLKFGVLMFKEIRERSENLIGQNFQLGLRYRGLLLRENFLGSLQDPKIKYMRRLLVDFL
ncbi:hypothetical protein IGI04_022725 [Brassica rapa subsp. trilocularis]|uniref:Uncharacterized protein n=1 Tax=Brassica rapa subsp. trilocularis TaxID=1813537 RepID=A0ABQ7M1S3_BRACM|nr:hypothetical protein IGI04_022725 [Brassica rapa subsp. trilocularis]